MILKKKGQARFTIFYLQCAELISYLKKVDWDFFSSALCCVCVLSLLSTLLNLPYTQGGSLLCILAMSMASGKFTAHFCTVSCYNVEHSI